MSEIFRGNLQLVWNSTSLGALLDCPRKYQYAILFGFTTADGNINIIFGLAYHKAVERYYFARSAGQDHPAALRTAVRGAMLDTWPDLLVDNYKSRPNLVRSIVWYLESFGEDDTLETLILSTGQPAVEITFAHELSLESPVAGEPYMLAGHLDRIARFTDGYLYFSDLKTTKSSLGEYYFQQYSPNNQMSLYDYSGTVIANTQLHGGIVDAVQIMVSGSRFQRGFVHRTPGQREEWVYDTGFWIKQAEQFAASNYWPKNEQSCYLCDFKSICSKDPKVRRGFLESNFKRRVINPLEVRT